MRKFKHLAQLSDNELMECMNDVEAQILKLQVDLCVVDVSGCSSKCSIVEYRHQLGVYKTLQKHFLLRSK